MSFLKNKFIIIVILAILAGGVLGIYLSNTKNTPSSDIVPVVLETGSGDSATEIGEVMQKLNELAE